MAFEDEEYPMDMDDDEEDYDNNVEPEISQPQPTDSDILNLYVIKLSEYVEEVKITPTALRQTLFEQNVRNLAEAQGLVFEDIILSSKANDSGYNGLIASLYPALAPHLSQAINEKNRTPLAQILGTAISATIWEAIEEKASKKDMTLENFLELIKRTSGDALFPLSSGLKVTEFLAVVTTDRSDSPKSDIQVITDNLALLKALETAPNKQEQVVEEEEEEEDEELDPEIEANTARVMNVYKDLFEVGFELQVPYGILTKEGVLRIKKNGKTKHQNVSSFHNIYNLINTITNKFLVQSELSEGKDSSDLREVQMRSGTNYYPEFQLGNLFGVLGKVKVDTWSDLSKNIKPEIKRNIKTNLNAGRDISSIVDGLTSCIIISEFDPNIAIKLRINVGNRMLDKNSFEREYAKTKNMIMAGVGELFHAHLTKSGVLEVIIVFNEAAFNGRPLFAYEAVQNLQSRGRKPSLKEMILGQDTSGKIMTVNLDNQQACIILVGAGQRSGKGVLTLNMLGTILAEGSPLIYLDGKPDMAPVLWDLGKKHGVSPAAWDLFESNGNVIGRGAPERMVVENPGLFGVLMYLKALQLMLISASLQAKGMEFLNGKRPFFIFDEAFATQMTMADAWKEVITTAKSKTADPTEKEWCIKVVEWAEKLDSGLPAVINSQLPKSGVSTIWLFQSMQPTSWNAYATDGLNVPKFNIMKNPIMSRLSLKLLGRGTADSEYALSNVKKERVIETRVLSDNGRHFAMTGTQKISSMESIKVFKPYLVLNEAHNGAKSVEGLRGVVSNDVWNAIAPEGELHPGAGFEGFASIIGADAIQNLSQGRAYLEAVLTAIGEMQNYNSIDDYLYDASIESFKNLGFMVNGAGNDSTKPEETSYVTGNTEESDLENPETVFNETDEYENENYDENTELDDNIDETVYKPDKYDRREKPKPSNTFNNNFDEDVQDDSHLSPPLTPEQEVQKEPHTPPSKRSGYTNIYQEPMVLPQNPFQVHGTSGNPISAINSIRMFSNFIMDEITKFSGDLGRIESFEVTSTGLVINDIAFRPTLDQEVIDSMPFDIKQQVQNGNIVELFHFENLKKFRNLSILRIDNSRLAEGRVRREIGLSPNRTWFKLFNKYRNLRELYIGGQRIVDQPTSEKYDDDGRGGFSLTEKLRGALGVGVNAVSNSRMERVWDSRPVRTIGKAAGWTVGIKVVSLAAMAFGPWGMLFAGLAGYGALKGASNRRDRR
jgi:hypothetical protein